ncbi:MAG: hypothetical protein ACOY4I_04220 [Bacillota bacterium]
MVRGLNDGSFDGNIANFPSLIKKILAGINGGVFYEETRKEIDEGIKFMEVFLAQLEKELND